MCLRPVVSAGAEGREEMALDDGSLSGMISSRGLGHREAVLSGYCSDRRDIAPTWGVALLQSHLRDGWMSNGIRVRWILLNVPASHADIARKLDAREGTSAIRVRIISESTGQVIVVHI